MRTERTTKPRVAAVSLASAIQPECEISKVFRLCNLLIRGGVV